MLGALILSPVLLLADIWHYPQLDVVHRHPLEAAVGGAVALLAVIALALVIARRPALLAPLAVIALPFRIPIGVENNTSNLLVPLYFVVAAGCLAWIGSTLWQGRAGARPAVAGTGGASVGTRGDRPYLARAAAGGDADPVRAAGALLRRLRQGAAADGVLLRPVRAAVEAAVGPRVGPRAARHLPEADRRPGGRVRRDRVRRVRDQDAAAQPGADRGQRRAHLLHGQLRVLRPRHLRALPGAGDDPAGRRAALRRPAADPDRRDGRAGDPLGRARADAVALQPGGAAASASRCWRRCAGRSGRCWSRSRSSSSLGGAAVAISPKTFGLNQGLNSASSGRANLVTGGIDLFKQRPICGYGSGLVRERVPRSQPAASTRPWPRRTRFRSRSPPSRA